LIPAPSIDTYTNEHHTSNSISDRRKDDIEDDEVPRYARKPENRLRNVVLMNDLQLPSVVVVLVTGRMTPSWDEINA
jgi:hypothetical protein